ncbi:MAG TPA: hypothetical protein VIF64_00570 [Pyrinomonadaceae bacterium]|jgi:hypothetical protein
MMVRWLCLTTLVLVAFSIPACKGDAKSQLVGKWEATLTQKRSGNETKVLWEFLPDGTFTAAPLGDPGTIVDKDKYQISADGQTLTFRSQLIDHVPCIINVSTMTGETPESLVKFKKL